MREHVTDRSDSQDGPSVVHVARLRDGSSGGPGRSVILRVIRAQLTDRMKRRRGPLFVGVRMRTRVAAPARALARVVVDQGVELIDDLARRIAIDR